MMAKSGIGLDHKTKMIEATDEAWESHVKVDPNARLMRYKTWPYYAAWAEIFGKDRATGVAAEDIGEASNNPTGQTSNPTPNMPEDDLNGVFAGWVEEHEPPTMPEKPESSGGAAKNKATRKRKTVCPDAISETVMKFCTDASKRLESIAERIGYQVDLGQARKEVFSFVDRIEGLSLQQKLVATKMLGQNTEDLEIFSGLPDDAKEEWARMKLAGTL